MPKYLIIDGYNAINKISQLEAKRDISLEASRMFFIRILQDFISRKRMFDKILVVFDSKEDALGVRKNSYGNVDVFFGTKDQDADNVIVSLLKKSSSLDQVTVSSDDNFVRNHSRAFRRQSMSIKELEEIILMKLPKKSRIRQEQLGSEKVQSINRELKEYWGL